MNISTHKFNLSVTKSGSNLTSCIVSVTKCIPC